MNRPLYRIILLFALLLPTAVTLPYFVLFADGSIALRQWSYGIGKTVQFLLPVVAVYLLGFPRLPFLRRRMSPVFLTPPHALRWWIAVGILFGVFGAAAGSVFYQFVLRDLAVMHVVQSVVEEKLRALGLQSLIIYVFFGAFYTVFHSLLEEYYWRWFVFGQLRMMFPFRASLLISSIGFTAHHIIVLGTYFGYAHPLTWVFALCVGIGGGVWAWMYERSGSLLAPWISHAVIDAAIFFIGYLMIGSLLTG